MKTVAWLKQEAERAQLRGYREKAAHLISAAAALSAAEKDTSVNVLLDLADHSVQCAACGTISCVPALSCDPRLLYVEVADQAHREVHFTCHSCGHVLKLVF